MVHLVFVPPFLFITVCRSKLQIQNDDCRKNVSNKFLNPVINALVAVTNTKCTIGGSYEHWMYHRWQLRTLDVPLMAVTNTRCTIGGSDAVIECLDLQLLCLDLQTVMNKKGGKLFNKILQ